MATNTTVRLLAIGVVGLDESHGQDKHTFNWYLRVLDEHNILRRYLAYSITASSQPVSRGSSTTSDTPSHPVHGVNDATDATSTGESAVHATGLSDEDEVAVDTAGNSSAVDGVAAAAAIGLSPEVLAKLEAQNEQMWQDDEAEKSTSKRKIAETATETSSAKRIKKRGVMEPEAGVEDPGHPAEANAPIVDNGEGVDVATGVGDGDSDVGLAEQHGDDGQAVLQDERADGETTVDDRLRSGLNICCGTESCAGRCQR
ncbi:hypothetical protein NX059_004051 [Plenodomus lindquistii]|nr:hypothetical protein NX059_004051 [Plenodomus lindquistii]